jgi:hypothetical protein
MQLTLSQWTSARGTPLRAAACALLVLASACSPGRTRPGSTTEPATIQVENRAFTDMTIYVIESGGSRRRLGIATGASTSSFTIPATLVGLGRELQFMADPIGSNRTATSNRLWVSPGQQVTLLIPPN